MLSLDVGQNCVLISPLFFCPPLSRWGVFFYLLSSSHSKHTSHRRCFGIFTCGFRRYIHDKRRFFYLPSFWFYRPAAYALALLLPTFVRPLILSSGERRGFTAGPISCVWFRWPLVISDFFLATIFPWSLFYNSFFCTSIRRVRLSVPSSLIPDFRLPVMVFCAAAVCTLFTVLIYAPCRSSLSESSCSVPHSQANNRLSSSS
ncbi:hypothetical protein GALMADRAFT_410465 [Galerina marginata CBS 339.88]|uniref:Uncharacterized protein n=1 Tax=Galerina marginata (strain CBS 339.88) TaxID=685588 RepID=A0A067TFB8_GALM3|nr:hypothetical protein GALMADRAFT_410465 [Galerina marginata CBS 339.88]